jgi:carbamoyltransferase
MFYLGKAHRLYPLLPHHLTLGAMYDRVGMALGLGVTGPAGKLMGLAAYGQPRFFDSKFVGNYYDHKAAFPSKDFASAWIYHCVKEARSRGYDMTAYGNPEVATAAVNADIAASTQKLFEAIRMRAVEALHGMLSKSRLRTANLCLSGGTALNCPSNTQIYNESAFNAVHVEPACDDGGLAIGAALALFHNIMDNPRNGEPPYPSAYQGVKYAEGDIETALEQHRSALRVEKLGAVGERAAQDLAANRVIAWYQGRSEAGPRALGHRSIIADPRSAENWARVNRIKKREQWRPFAPAVLESEAQHWFGDAPAHSPHMLFNARVLDARIPAVTHVDGTARIQTVRESDGGYHDLIQAFARYTEVPVVMNTSFNGPGQPIVETPSDAVDFFVQSELDALYIGDFRVERVSV